MERPSKEIFNSESDCDFGKPTSPVECGICGENHSVTECTILKVTNHIRDKTIPSKARLTLPDTLEIQKLCDGTYNIYTKNLLERGTQFGPFEAKKLFTLHPSIDFPLKIFTNIEEDLAEYFLDTSDENECSWMIFVSPASSIEEQNIICYQDGEHLYYGAIKDVNPGEPLKVWYSPHYAVKMKKTQLDTCQEIYVEEKAVDIEAILKKKKNITQRDSWSCKFCGKVEKELSVFAFHLLDHYRAQANKICTMCKDSFQTRQSLKKHLKMVHGDNLKQTDAITVKESEILLIKVKENDSKDTSLGGPLLLNNINTDSLDTSSLLLSQTDLVTMETENLNLNVDNIINENVKHLDHFNFELNPKESESEQLICDICLKSFLKLKSLIQHIDQHTGKFVCQYCNMAFARKENLVHHACNLSYKLKCPLCEKIFCQQKYLTQHVKSSHNKEFTCGQCGRFYCSKQNLAEHSCVKAPNRKKETFPCNFCSKIFFHKKNWYRHVSKHKADPEQKFVCEVCNKTLVSRKNYLKHVKVHDGAGFSCDICSKMFSRKDYLKEHKNMHNGQAQAATCGICEQTLKTKKLLKIHMQTHTEIKRHKCDICQASFKQRTNLTKHVNKHKAGASKLESLFKEEQLIYNCPRCDKNMKLKSSLLRHLKNFHPRYKISKDVLKPTTGKLCSRKTECSTAKEDESVMDLKETIENMNFNTDEVNNCSENNDINIEIDNILNNTENLDHFLNDTNDRIVQNLITASNEITSREVCLSLPDLSDDQEIKLSNNAYILANGAIVEPQQSSSNVVMYVPYLHKLP